MELPIHLWSKRKHNIYILFVVQFKFRILKGFLARPYGEILTTERSIEELITGGSESEQEALMSLEVVVW